jgi:hypothetical protein
VYTYGDWTRQAWLAGGSIGWYLFFHWPYSSNLMLWEGDCLKVTQHFWY